MSKLWLKTDKCSIQQQEVCYEFFWWLYKLQRLPLDVKRPKDLYPEYIFEHYSLMKVKDNSFIWCVPVNIGCNYEECLNFILKLSKPNAFYIIPVNTEFNDVFIKAQKNCVLRLFFNGKDLQLSPSQKYNVFLFI